MAKLGAKAKQKRLDVKLAVTDDNFVEDAKLLLAYLEPLKVAIMITQADSATPSDVYACWINLHKEFMNSCNVDTTDYKKLDNDIRTEVVDLLTSRFKFMFHPTQLLAYALDPRFMVSSTVTGAEMSRWFKHIAKDFVSDDVKQMINVDADDDEEDILEKIAAKMFDQYGQMGVDSLTKDGIWKDSVTNSLEPLKWWNCWGRKEYPCLYPLADKLFRLPASSAGCERNLSTQDHIVSKKRNRLGNQTSEKLIAIHWNLRRILRLEDPNGDTEASSLLKCDNKATAIKISTAFRNHTTHGKWKHPSFSEGVVVLGYNDDDAAINNFESMHANDELSIQEEQRGEEGDDEDADDEERDLDEVDREAFMSIDWDVLPCPEKVPQDIPENVPCAVYFGDPYHDWFIGTITEVQKRGKKKSVTLPNVTAQFSDGVSNILASKENYGDTKTWVLLRKRDVEVVGSDEGSSSEDDSESNRPSKKQRRNPA
jgi:hypothetical protein